MNRMIIGPWVIETDVEQTKKFYDNFHLITDDCDCDDCANYVLAAEKFPAEIKDLFTSLGVDPCKEGEVSEYRENADGTHLYSAFYHIVGRVIAGPQVWKPSSKSSTYSLAGFEISFTEELDLVPEGFPSPTVQVDIQMNIPWLLS